MQTAKGLKCAREKSLAQYKLSSLATCGLFEVEISRRTNKDGKYIEGNTIKVDIASDIAIVFYELF